MTAAAEFLANRPYLRPRSRSMPRVTYESSRYLTLPEATPWPSSGGSLRLPRGRSAGALGGAGIFGGGAFGAGLASSMAPGGALAGVVHATSSPAATPMEEKQGPPATVTPAALSCAPNSRRSSLSPSDRGRRRDSPACLLVEVPPWQRSVLTLLEVCRRHG